MESKQRGSANRGEARDDEPRLCPVDADRVFDHKLVRVACALCMGLLIAPSAFAAEQSLQAAMAPGGAVAVAAAQESIATGPVAQVELESVVPGLESTNNSTARQYRIDDDGRFVMAPALRTRVWWDTPLAGLGAGADLISTASVPGLRPLRPVLGVRANMSERTRLIYEVRGPAASPASVSAVLLPGAREPEARLALEFRSAKSATQELRNGLFRFQLSNSSSLFLKPRSGGVLVSYRSQF